MNFTNENFWDCECEDHYIHPKTCTKCPRCGAEEEDGMPDSHQSELDESMENWHCQCRSRVFTNGTLAIGNRVKFKADYGFPKGFMAEKFPTGGTIVAFIDSKTVRVHMDADNQVHAYYTKGLEKETYQG